MKSLIYAAVLLLIVSSLSFGQSATVTATVNAVLTVTNTHALVFGNVVKGTPKTVASADANAAAFSVAGEPNAISVLAVTFPSTISDGTNTMPFAGVSPIYNTTNTQTGATTYSTGTGGNATLDAAGNLYFWIGGTVSPAAGQVSGNYTGTITVAVAYP